jgi:8-amino-3,8-dideoxy-alpha-D-manno-octulosonate transaminase
VLVDIDETLTLDPESVRAAITPATKCVMPVHMCGSMADLDALQAICKEHGLLLLEDACQSIGARYKGKYLGTIGDAGTFSFDFVKTITCAEGGVVMTNNESTYSKCDGYTDHGHDHAGVDRGADLHPFIGYNYRISELHAAVGLAQLRKLPQFLAIQQKNAGILRSYLEQVPEISFRVIPEGGEDSHTFISWFLPAEALTRAVVAQLKEDGVLPGNFYWFDNNWHYIRKWDHLKTAASLHKLGEAQTNALTALQAQAFPVSDAIMSRCICTAISLAWTEEQVHARGAAILAAVQKALAKQGQPA